MQHESIAFIGGGTMAYSLIGGLIANGHPPTAISVADPTAERRDQLSHAFGIETTADNATALATATVGVLAVTPQQMEAVCRDLAPTLQTRDPLIVSVAAGIRLDALATWLDYAGSIVRCMPNTPTLLGAGVSGLYPSAAVTSAQAGTAEAILRSGGDVVWVDDEALLDSVTAISGSGPAYFFHLMATLETAARERGLDADQAHRLVTATALGAASMAGQSDVSPATLRDRVASPGGTTAAALDVLEHGDMAQLVDRAVDAARTRANELGTELGEQ